MHCSVSPTFITIHYTGDQERLTLVMNADQPVKGAEEKVPTPCKDTAQGVKDDQLFEVEVRKLKHRQN